MCARDKAIEESEEIPLDGDPTPIGMVVIRGNSIVRFEILDRL